MYACIIIRFQYMYNVQIRKFTLLHNLIILPMAYNDKQMHKYSIVLIYQCALAKIKLGRY